MKHIFFLSNYYFKCLILYFILVEILVSILNKKEKRFHTVGIEEFKQHENICKKYIYSKLRFMI